MYRLLPAVFFLFGWIQAEQVSLTATFRDVWPCAANAFSSPAPYACGQKTKDGVDCTKNLCSQNFEYRDFGQVYSGDSPDPGIVQNALDSDNKPQFNPNYKGRSIIDSKEFPQWFRTTPNFNFPITQNLTFFNCDPKKTSGCDDRLFVKDNKWNPNTGAGYWPLDQQGWGDWWNLPVSKQDHNFGFTMEIATRFVYRGGEIFTFNGDDDLWIFINYKLVIDLGGVHNGLQRTINLDSLGLTVNRSYPFHMFYCERHTPGSGFYASTSVGFTCDKIDRCSICWGDGQSCCTCDDSDVCTIDSCDPNSVDQKCIHTPIDCDDKNQCTRDSCKNGCQHVDTSADCNLSDKCYNYGCSSTSGCFSQKKGGCESDICTKRTCNPSDGSCTEVDACPKNVACQQYVGCSLSQGCQYKPLDCSNPVECGWGYCDKTSGQCNKGVLDINTCKGCNSSTCKPENQCRLAYCDGTGTCQHTDKCVSPSPCLNVTCDMTTGECSTVPACHTDDKVCKPKTCTVVGNSFTCSDAVDPCDDGNACTIDTCTAVDGNATCTNQLQTNPDPCIVDTCVNKTIVQVPFVCSNEDKCLDVQCESGVGCVTKNVTIPDYGNKCIITDCDRDIGIFNTTYPCSPSDRCKCDPTDGCQCQPLSIGAIAGISAGAVAGAVVGGVAGAAVLGLAGKKGFDYFQAGNIASGGVQNNPLYETNVGSHVNPLAE